MWLIVQINRKKILYLDSPLILNLLINSDIYLIIINNYNNKDLFIILRKMQFKRTEDTTYLKNLVKDPESPNF